MEQAEIRSRIRRHYVLEALLVTLFNLLPLYFVFAGIWNSFEVMAFYWAETVTAGIFALIRSLAAAAGAALEKNAMGFIGNIAVALFLPAHFGAFIVLICFVVGSFLPDDTPTRLLTDPFVPFFMVAEHIHLVRLLPALLFWEALLFARQVLRARGDLAYRLPDPVGTAYGRLAILFVSGVIGLLLAMNAHEKIWGAAVLVFVKTACALVALGGRCVNDLHNHNIYFKKPSG